MKRLCTCTIAFLVFLACTTLSSEANDRKEQPSKNEATHENALQPARSKLTIVFRGLMVFRPDPSRRILKLGILRAPKHAFRIEVREISPASVSSSFVPLESVRESETDLWSFELGSSSNQGVSFYQNGSFDRKAGIGDARDFRWAIDLEGKEFYNQPLTMKVNQLGPVMRLTHWEFYTKTKTSPLLRNKRERYF